MASIVRQRRLALWAIVLSLGLASDRAHGAQAPDAAFTVANYPVEARAQDAVKAKEKALADGQQAAFRSLLKRLLPVTAYRRIPELGSVAAADLIDGVAVRSEQNSTTEYIATLDFSFEPRAVRDLLRRQGIPFVDAQAPAVVLVPAYSAPAPGTAGLAALGFAQGSRTWTAAWKGLDLEHSLTPVRIEVPKSPLPPAALAAAQSDAGAAQRALAGIAKSDRAVLAIAEPEPGAKRLHVTLAGEDTVGPFVLKRAYRFDPGDLAYAAELAAVVGLGILEGRWKAARVGTSRDGEAALGQQPAPVQLLVEFRNLQEWQDIRRRIVETPGVEDFDVGGLSARSADVVLRYPGGGERLTDALAAKGIQLQNMGGTWLARSPF